MLFSKFNFNMPLGMGGIPTKTPLQAATLPAGWWDASDATTLYQDAGTTLVTADGQACQQMNDKSGNSRHFSGAGTARPLYKTARVNGKSTLLFDGTNDVMTAAAISNFIANNAYTFIGVCKPAALDQNSATIYNNDVFYCDASGYIGYFMKSAPTGHIYNWDGNQDSTTNTIPAAGTAWLVVARHSGGNIISAINQGAENSAASGNTSTLTGALQIGGRVAFTNLDWCELAVWNVVLSAADIAAVANLMKQKWGTA